MNRLLIILAGLSTAVGLTAGAAMTGHDEAPSKAQRRRRKRRSRSGTRCTAAIPGRSTAASPAPR